jgi:hypothetical protein
MDYLRNRSRDREKSTGKCRFNEIAESSMGVFRIRTLKSIIPTGLYTQRVFGFLYSTLADKTD